MGTSINDILIMTINVFLAIDTSLCSDKSSDISIDQAGESPGGGLSNYLYLFGGQA